MQSFDVRTGARRQYHDVTPEIRRLLAESGVRNGVGVIYCPHTTAAVTVNENADPDVVHDVLLWSGRLIPKQQAGFRHAEGNSDSHIQAILVGPSVSLIVSAGELVLGRWQGVYLAEFDGPRTRTLHVQWIASAERTD